MQTLCESSACGKCTYESLRSAQINLDRARQNFGPITGVVHGAGVLADKRLEDKTLAQFDLVTDTRRIALAMCASAIAMMPARSSPNTRSRCTVIS